MSDEVTQVLEQIGVRGIMKLMPLKDRTVSELGIDDLRLIMEVLGVTAEVNDELLQAGVAILKGHGIDRAADIIKNPETVKQLMCLVRGRPSVAVRILECPHCRGFFFDPLASGQKASSS